MTTPVVELSGSDFLFFTVSNGLDGSLSKLRSCSHHKIFTIIQTFILHTRFLSILGFLSLLISIGASLLGEACIEAESSFRVLYTQ